MKSWKNPEILAEIDAHIEKAVSKAAKQIEDTGAKLLIAPCHNCRDQIMKSLLKEYDMKDVEVKYLWELVADSLVIEGVSDTEG